jgi:hypothetical protein
MIWQSTTQTAVFYVYGHIMFGANPDLESMSRIDSFQIVPELNFNNITLFLMTRVKGRPRPQKCHCEAAAAAVAICPLVTLCHEIASLRSQ